MVCFQLFSEIVLKNSLLDPFSKIILNVLQNKNIFENLNILNMLLIFLIIF